MSFILVPERGGANLRVNGWNWRPTLLLLHSENLIAGEYYVLLGTNGCGATMDANLALRAAKAVEHKPSTMRAGQRMLADLTVVPGREGPLTFSPGTKIEEIDSNDLYSATYEWLQMFVDFCRTSGGFKVC